jgi:N-acetylglucosaminyldiphosphoundecaprenol N-acetyl-beta-D-mannosaminyltransferase
MPPLIKERANILGVGISPIDMHDLLAACERWIERRESNYICVTNTHLVMMCQKDEGLRRIHNQAGLCTPDGTPLYWLTWLMGHHNVRRVCGPDIMLACFEYGVSRGWKHFFCGAMPGVAERLAQRMQERFPGLQVAGAWCPPFRPLTDEEDAQLIDIVQRSRTDFFWLAIGPSAMERFMAEHANRMNVPVMAGVGAAFDFLSGNKPQAPKWMATIGLEWFFRMCTEPRRLFVRYLTNNPAFIYHVLLQALGKRPPALEPAAPGREAT